MSTSFILGSIAHLLLAFFIRKKYISKYKKASLERAHFEVENIQLKSKLETLEAFLDESTD